MNPDTPFFCRAKPYLVRRNQGCNFTGAVVDGFTLFEESGLEVHGSIVVFFERTRKQATPKAGQGRREAGKQRDEKTRRRKEEGMASLRRERYCLDSLLLCLLCFLSLLFYNPAVRCPNCNGPLEDDWCDACQMDLPGLRRAAFRRLISKLGIFLLGILALVPGTRIYPPLEIDRMFIFFGVLFVVTLGLVMWVEYQLRRDRPAEIGSRILRSLVIVPWILTGLLLANGRFDRDPPQQHQAQVAGTFRSAGMVMTDRLVLPSWRSGRRWERVAVSARFIAGIRPGDSVQVFIKPGLAGIAWVAGVEKLESLPPSHPAPELREIR